MVVRGSRLLVLALTMLLLPTTGAVASLWGGLTRAQAIIRARDFAVQYAIEQAGYTAAQAISLRRRLREIIPSASPETCRDRARVWNVFWPESFYAIYVGRGATEWECR